MGEVTLLQGIALPLEFLHNGRHTVPMNPVGDRELR